MFLMKLQINIITKNRIYSFRFFSYFPKQIHFCTFFKFNNIYTDYIILISFCIFQILETRYATACVFTILQWVESRTDFPEPRIGGNYLSIL